MVVCGPVQALRPSKLRVLLLDLHGVPNTTLFLISASYRRYCDHTNWLVGLFPMLAVKTTSPIVMFSTVCAKCHC